MSNISRRTFLGSSAAAFAAMAGFAYLNEYEKNEPKIKQKDIYDEEYTTDVLVVGGGMAALFAAVKAKENGAKTIIVSKGRLGSSGLTPFAKGFFSYDKTKEKLSVNEFVAKVSRSAINTNNEAYTKQLAIYSKQRAKELEQWGFFDNVLYNKPFMKPIEEQDIPLIERVMITNLIKENGKIAGAMGFSIDTKKIILLKAKSVILCTGSGGFKSNGFPICDVTHDGTIMAYEIGAKVTGKEWNDGHPANEKNSADSYGNWGNMFNQKPSLTSVEIRHDLGVDLNYKAYMLGGNLKMQPPGMGDKNNQVSGGPFVPQEFRHGGRPPHGEDGEKRGMPPPPKGGKGAPPGMAGIKVGGSTAGMSIHKSEGLTPINDKCESTIKGLYAAGDALGSHMAGGIYTQIGSSLAGSAVQGAIAGEEAAKYSKDIELQKIPKEKIEKIKTEILAPLNRKHGFKPSFVTQLLQGIMIPNFVLYIKKEKMLQAALAFIEELEEHSVPMLIASDLHELRLAHETKNMIINAKMKLLASSMRKESRCSHYRLDYPNIDRKNWEAWINIFKDENGEMTLEKQAFGTWTKA